MDDLVSATYYELLNEYKHNLPRSKLIGNVNSLASSLDYCGILSSQSGNSIEADYCGVLYEFLETHRVK